MSVECRSNVDRVSTDIPVDMSIEVTYKIHDPDNLVIRGFSNVSCFSKACI